MTDLTEALRQFDATEANLKRLENIWKEIEPLIPSGFMFDVTSPELSRYSDLCRSFRHICKTMPTLDGFELSYDLWHIDDIQRIRLDSMELGDPAAELGVEREFYKQGGTIGEYRFRFAAARRDLVRAAMERAIAEIDELLVKLKPAEEAESSDKVSGTDWDALNERVDQLGVLMGSSIKRPRRLQDLYRHLHFGYIQDLHDIIAMDWPSVKSAIQDSLYGPTDPVPVSVSDLTALSKSPPKGRVITALKWDSLDDGDFERLVYNLISDTEGYSNPGWFTHPNAADRGRDISVTRSVSDPLTGTETLRVLIQCKHWRSRGIGVSEVTTLLGQMRLWEPPKVAELIIATTGKFTSDAVDYIEKRNHEREPPRIYMWPDSHLEWILASRPHLVAEFKLR